MATRSQKIGVLIFLGILLVGTGLALPLLRNEVSSDREATEVKAMLPPTDPAPLVIRPPSALPMRPADAPALPEPRPLRGVAPPASVPDTLLRPVVLPHAPRSGFSSEKVSFAVKVKDEIIPYRIFGVFVMPGEILDLEAVFTERPRNSDFVAMDGKTKLIQPDQWQWTAPEKPGIYQIKITDVEADEMITLNVFVKTPFDPTSTSLNGYKIGQYEQKPLRGNPVYNPPRGFVEVRRDNRDTPVSPHFTLGQFLCKQQSDWPKYILLRERLTLKLEMILEQVNAQGIDAHTLHVMSAFRTPWYNKSIGNTTIYSRHLYGGAADIFVDTDGNNNMDDLDRDGQISKADATRLAAIIEDNIKATWYQPFLGGLGIYAPASHRGPFIHVDVRGQRARW